MNLPVQEKQRPRGGGNPAGAAAVGVHQKSYCSWLPFDATVATIGAMANNSRTLYGRRRTIVTTNYSREQAAQPVIALVERFGFDWETADDAPVAGIGPPASGRDPRTTRYPKGGRDPSCNGSGEMLPPIVAQKTAISSTVVPVSRQPYGPSGNHSHHRVGCPV